MLAEIRHRHDRLLSRPVLLRTLGYERLEVADELRGSGRQLLRHAHLVGEFVIRVILPEHWQRHVLRLPRLLGASVNPVESSLQQIKDGIFPTATR